MKFETADADVGMGHFEISIGGREFVTQESPCRLPFLSEGKNIVTVRAFDRLGNSRDASIELLIDTVAPDEPDNFRVVPGNGSAVLKWTEGDDETMSYVLQRKRNAGSTPTITVLRGSGRAGSGENGGTLYFEQDWENLQNGEIIRFSIYGIDRAGNIGPSVAAEATVGVARAEYSDEEDLFVEYEDVDLFIPAESLGEKTEQVVISEIISPDMEEQAINPIISPIYDFSIETENPGGPESRGHAKFKKRYIGMIDYDESLVPEGFPEEKLGVYYFNTEWGRWFIEESAGVDTENNRIIFSTDHFSHFSVQPTVVNDLTPQELREVEYTPFSAQTKHEPVSVSPKGGSVSTSMTEFVLPGRDGFDFELRRIYDTGTARMDNSGFAVNYSIDISVTGSMELIASGIGSVAKGAALGIVSQIGDSIKKYFTNNGDFSYALGQGWRLNLPYIRGSNGGVLARTPSGSFYDILSMDKKSVIDIGLYRTLVFENHEYEDFTLEVKQVRSDITIALASAMSGRPPIPGWLLFSAKMTMADGSSYKFDSLGRLLEMKSSDGKNTVTVNYNGFLLESIVDSMDRKVRFEYETNTLIDSYSIVPQIKRIWVENDPQGREVRYSYGKANDTVFPTRLPLMSMATDIGGRKWRYDYDTYFLAATDFSVKVNALSLLLSVFTAGLANEALAKLGLGSINFSGGYQAEWSFVMSEASGPGIGENLIRYKVHSLDYTKVEVTDYILGLIPTAIKTSFHLEQRLAAGSHIYTDPVLNVSRRKNYSFDFSYTGKGNQFTVTKSTVSGEYLREVRYFDRITKKRRRYLSWSDAVTDFSLVQQKSYFHMNSEKIPLEVKMDTYDVKTGEFLRSQATEYDERSLRPKQVVVTHSDLNAMTTQYRYDGWGNIVYQREETAISGSSQLMETWMYYNGSAPPSGPEWPATPLETQTGLPDRIHDRLLGRAVKHSVNGPEGPMAPKTRYSYFLYNGLGKMTKEALRVSGKWAVSQYAYDADTGELTRTTDPDGAAADIIWNYEAPGDSYTKTTVSRDVKDADGGKADIRTVSAYDDVFGFLLWEKDGRGYVTRLWSDSLGRPVRIRRPDDGDDPDWMPGYGPPPGWRTDNPETRIAYNDRSLSITVAQPLKAVQTYQFAHDGQLVSKTAVSRGGYDKEGRPLAAPQDVRHRWSYDAYGRMTGYIDPSGLRVDFSHDSQDRLTEEVFHLEGGRTARRSYRHSVSGDVKTIIDELGNKTIEEYDMSGRLLIRSHYSSEGRTLFRESFSYDALGNRISVTDAAGSSTLTEYSERSRPVKVTGPEAEYFDGNQSYRTAARTRNEYSPAGHLIAEHSSSRRGGDTISMETDALGRVITETVHVRGEEGLTRKYTAKHFYDENGSRVRTVDPLGGETRTEYTPRGQKKSITDPDGHKTGFTYDALDRQTSVTGPRGSSGRYGENYTADLYYDDLDRLTRAVLPAIEPGGERGEALFSYDARGNLLSRIEPDGSRTEYTYTARHWKSSETQIGRTLDGAVRSYTVRYTYNDIGQMTVRQEPGGERTRFEYDALGRKLKEILPDQSKRQYYWDMRGLLEAQVDGIGAVTRHSYDELGREVSMTDPEGHTSGYRYDQRGNIAQITDPSGESFTAWFDERGLVTRERDSRGREKRFGYDEAGRPVFLEDPRGTEITYTHTPAGLVESISYQNGGETHIQSFRYDEAGALMEANDNGVLTRYNEKDGEYVPNPYDLQTSVSETLGGKTLTSRYTYDIMKRRTSTGYSSGGKTEYLYNTLGRLERIPGIIDESINFDADGLAAGYELANGVRAEFEYDSRRRAVSVIHRDSSGSTGQSYRLTCDMEDNIIQRNGDHFSYDRSSQMTSAVLSGDASIEEYPLEDREFALGSIRSDVRADRPAEIPGGELTLDWGAGSLVIDLGYAYKTKTVIVRPRSINSRLRKPQLSLSTALYNMEGQYTEQPFGMETDEQTGEITFTLEYGVFTRFIKLHSHINALDAEGEPLMDPGSFDLDPESVRVYALTGGVNKFYSYKPDGGRAVHSALTDTMRSDRYSYYPDSDLVQIAGDYACRYDENGNMTEKGDRYTESGGEITIHKEGRYALYKYDLLNRLVSVSRLNGEGEVEVAASYRYSHRNLRIERTDKAGTVRYVFDLDGNIIEEHRGDELIRYVFRRGKHLAKITPDGTYYYGTDRLGSTTVMFDGEGSVVWQGDVSPFGELVSSEGSIEERVKFTGKDYDEAAGLYYFNARWYDAELGRFTTEDPARDGRNWYVYVRNNPLRFVDPWGLEDISIGGQISFAGGQGNTVGVGIVIDTDNLMESGIYGQGGESRGGGVSVSVGIGVYPEIEGRASGMAVSVPVSGTGLGIYVEGSIDEEGEIGVAGGISFGVGLTAEQTNTKTLTIQSVVDGLKYIGKEINKKWNSLFGSKDVPTENKENN